MTAMNTSEVCALVDNWKKHHQRMLQRVKTTYIHTCINTYRRIQFGVYFSQIGEIYNLVTFVYVNGLHIQKHIPTYTHAIILVHFMFQIYTHFWNNQTIKAFHFGVPDKTILILDHFAEEDPDWIHTELIFGENHSSGVCRLPGISDNLTTIATAPTYRCKAC